ncbi:HEAT repeat domain-containing protein [Allocoleopsis franciscana]|uniref:HEAT repeat-containing protein n=1 Tax=Allocoleopsis franciscana PCC 7113 TaxID=1173027 RepID=K9WPI9_9CYAN|nr:HEAT repeat domain-containing protein [Allocoleopsis franciscana]AFZ21726.1 HEAT repeat-containing protein [Allocoleopsis franciscana PCC 7113]
MNSRISLALSLLTILTFLADKTPATAQRETFSSPPSVPAKPGNRETAKPIVVAELVEQLRTADVEERRKIIQQLSNTEQNIVPALVRAMEEPDPLVKSGVAEVLGNLTDAAVPAIPELIEMMNDGRRAIVPASSISRSYLSPPPLPTLPPPVSVFAPSSSATVQERRSPSTPPQNPENLLRITAIAALGKIGLPARTLATPPLTQALQDADPWVKLNATWALSEIGASVPILSHWLEALQHPDPNLRRSAADIFQDSRSLLRKVLGAEANASTIAQLLSALKDDDFTVRNAASDGLKLLGTGALPGLIQGLKAPEPIVRLEAAQLIGNLGGAAQSAVPELVALLGDTGRYVPPTSNQYGLFSRLPLRPLPRFLRTQQYSPVPDNPEQLVRVNAAIALGQLGDRSAIPALTTALKDNNPWMQLATGWALLRLGQTQGLPVVGRLVQYPDRSIQREALSQLQGYGSQSTPYILPYYKARLESADDNERNGAIIQVGKFGPAALDLVPKLRTMLVGNQKNSPGYAATILGQIARDTAVAWHNGSLSAKQRQQAIAELTKVLNIMQAPKARFNREPVERVRNALTKLRGVTP